MDICPHNLSRPLEIWPDQVFVGTVWYLKSVPPFHLAATIKDFLSPRCLLHLTAPCTPASWLLLASWRRLRPSPPPRSPPALPVRAPPRQPLRPARWPCSSFALWGITCKKPVVTIFKARPSAAARGCGAQLQRAACSCEQFAGPVPLLVCALCTQSSSVFCDEPLLRGDRLKAKRVRARCGTRDRACSSICAALFAFTRRIAFAPFPALP